MTAVGKLGSFGSLESIDVLGGFEFYVEGARANRFSDDVGDPRTYYGGKRTVRYENYSTFAQVEVDTQWVNMTVGGRYHHHSKVGGKFVPRVALTRVFGDFHAKALFSQAFRTPQIEVIQLGGDNIKSETTTSYEVELGYRASENLSLVVNAFFINISNILFYSSVDDTYENFNSVANYGFEAEARYSDSWGSLTLGYSFYRNHRNKAPSLCTSGGIFDVDSNAEYENCGTKDGLLLGFPAHKLTFNGSYLITKKISFNVNGSLISKRITYAVGLEKRRSLNTQLFTNIYLQYQGENINLGIGVRDIYNNEYAYVQPFYSGVREQPGRGRELFVKASYSFNGIPFIDN